eukprot:6179262-Pleurochrysis_carterae.AAC.2
MTELKTDKVCRQWTVDGSGRRCGCAISGSDIAQSQKHDAVAARERLCLVRTSATVDVSVLRMYE